MTKQYHSIQGHQTNRRVEYLINPGRTVVIGSDCCEPGVYSNEFDKHIDHCVHSFTRFADQQPVFVEALQKDGLKLVLPQSSQPHEWLVKWTDKNNVEIIKLSNNTNYGIFPYAPARHAFVFGIHADLCVQHHLVALTSNSAFTRGVHMLGATYALHSSEGSHALPQINPQCDALAIENCEIVK